MTKAAASSKVAVLGASANHERISYKAVRVLKKHGFAPIPVHPAGHIVDGIPALKSLDDISEPPDTLTMYVNAGISDREKDRILRLKPRRVVFNPGAENPDLARTLRENDIEVVEACTLVMLRNDEF